MRIKSYRKPESFVVELYRRNFDPEYVDTLSAQTLDDIEVYCAIWNVPLEKNSQVQFEIEDLETPSQKDSAD